ncbi:MAG: hypothetical protein QG551_97 [Patescibacteria group bacterium]|jgi:FKBP-type peptidyl-prolyl cis-trans isomerase|nr:hypothetical protein [Patescibacteria group bacterium]
MNKNLIVSILVVLLFIVGVYLIIKNSKPKSENMQNSENTSEVSSENNNNVVDESSSQGSSQQPQLSMVITKQGTGDVVSKEGDVVSVNYVGAFEDGKIFDSSLDRGVPFEFTLGAGQVIAGWDMGVMGMKIGESRRLVIPSDFAYGPNDYGPIPGGSTLIFDVELVGIK